MGADTCGSLRPGQINAALTSPRGRDMPHTKIACSRRRWAYRGSAARALLATWVLVATAATAHALDILPNERATREACERRFCEIVLDGKPAGPPLKCDMVKTWDRVKIKKNGEKSTLKWGFGDARCQVTLDVPRARIVSALKDSKHIFLFDKQTIQCKIEGEDNKVSTLEIDAAPKLKLKDGKAYKVWVNVKDVRGDSNAKSLVWTASKLADGLGIFHKDSVNAINKFIHETCQTDYGKGGKKADKPVKAEVP